MSNIIDLFSYSFMVKALIVGIIVSLCSSLIGVSLVLRRNSMIGDGLSHVGFGAFAIATVLGLAPLEFAIPIVIIVSFMILKINENNKIHGDALIALISSSALAIGTFVVSITKGVNTDINNYLFGSILAVSDKDVYISIILGIIIILFFLTSYNKIFAITFDQKFAESIGINTSFYNMLFAILCSLTIVIGMRLLGSLLISSLIIFPTLTSRELFKSFKKVMISSIIVGIISFIIGLILSYYLEGPTGATIVLVNLFTFLIFKIISFCKK